MQPMQGSFNANQFEPNQGFGIHPPCNKAPFTITNTTIKENSAKDGGYLLVEFTSSMGVISNIYNIWNKSPKAVEIAHGQLSALCRAVGRYQIDWSNEAAALRGGIGLMDVVYQDKEAPGPDNPNAKGYTELKKVYDAAGNEPGKPPAQPQSGFTQQQPQPQPQPQNQPLQQQPGGGWGNQAPQQQAAPQGPNGWQQPSQQQQPNPAALQNQPGQAWQPGGAAPNPTPPWGNR